MRRGIKRQMPRPEGSPYTYTYTYLPPSLLYHLAIFCLVVLSSSSLSLAAEWHLQLKLCSFELEEQFSI